MTGFNAPPKFSRQILLLTTGIFLLAATEGALAKDGHHSHDHGGNPDGRGGMTSDNSDHGNHDGMKTHNSYQDGGKHAGHHKDKGGSDHAELNKDKAEGKHRHKDKGGDEHAALNKDKAEGKHHHKDKGEDKYASHKKGKHEAEVAENHKQKNERAGKANDPNSGSSMANNSTAAPGGVGINNTIHPIVTSNSGGANAGSPTSTVGISNGVRHELFENGNGLSFDANNAGPGTITVFNGTDKATTFKGGSIVVTGIDVKLAPNGGVSPCSGCTIKPNPTGGYTVVIDPPKAPVAPKPPATAGQGGGSILGIPAATAHGPTTSTVTQQ